MTLTVSALPHCWVFCKNCDLHFCSASLKFCGWIQRTRNGASEHGSMKIAIQRKTMQILCSKFSIMTYAFVFIFSIFLFLPAKEEYFSQLFNQSWCSVYEQAFSLHSPSVFFLSHHIIPQQITFIKLVDIKWLLKQNQELLYVFLFVFVVVFKSQH